MVRSLGEATKELNRLVEKARKLLPLSRGGVDPNPQGGRKKRIPPKPLTRLPTSPTDRLGRVKSSLTEEQIRFKPQPIEASPKFKPIARRNRKEIQTMDTTGDDMLDELINAGVSEDTIRMIALDIEDEVRSMTPTQRRERARAINESRQFERQNITPRKKPRKVSAYSKRFGIELKKLKKLHPRTKIGNLMTKAHRRTKSAMKKK